jgi:hypothetical protein
MEEHASPLRIRTLNEWQNLRPLTKKALLDASLSERSFTPARLIDSFYASSGTTGSLPLFGPRACIRGPEYRSAFHDFKKPVLSSIILPHMMERALSAISGERVIALDPKHLRASVRLARAAGADSVLAHSFLMPLICEELRLAGTAKDIRYVEIAGEPCTKEQYEHLRQSLPQAVITPVYGAREVEGPIGIPCRALGGEPLEVYHPHPEYLLELIDENGAIVPLSSGAEGELLVTAYAGEPFATPLIRYRIGDVVRVVESSCGKHGLWSFSVLGRAEADFVKVPGGVLRSDEIARALKACGAVSSKFQAEVEDYSGIGGPSVGVVLRLALDTAQNSGDFIEKISSTLRVAPSYTYANGVREGFYAPLRILPLTQKDNLPSKQRRIVRNTAQ